MNSPKIRLMLVRDPEDCVKALCNMESIFDLHQYTNSYESVRQRIKPIHVKNAHTHFYSLRIFGLIEQDPDSAKGRYRKTEAGNKICKLLNSENSKELENKLRYLLLNNPEKGKLFQDFEDFVSKRKKRTIKEIIARYDELTAVSLISWSEFAGIIEKDNTKHVIWHLSSAMEKEIPLKEFWKEIQENYDKLQTTDTGLQKVFVDINDLRTTMCLKSNWSNRYWNKKFTQILNSSYGKNIRLYGSIPSEFENKENFIYNDIKYALIRIKER